MTANIHREIERKFLIKLTPGLLSACSVKTEIIQTYLMREEPDIQRRVRHMLTAGRSRYYYTEKRFISAVTREENEREICSEDYEKLLTEADKSLTPVEKTRRILEYNGQRFEIDIYPFSEELATMELELDSESRGIDFPPCAEIIKEVTGVKGYSNGELAKNQRFPE